MDKKKCLDSVNDSRLLDNIEISSIVASISQEDLEVFKLTFIDEMKQYGSDLKHVFLDRDNLRMLNLYSLLKIANDDIVKYINKDSKTFAAFIKGIFSNQDFIEKHKIWGLDFSKIKFNVVELQDCIFDECNFSQSLIYKSDLDNCQFISCDCTFLQVIDSALQSAYIFDSKCGNSSFKESTLYGVLINDSDFSCADFSGSNMIEIEMNNVNLDNAKFDQSTSINKGKFNSINWGRADTSVLNITVDQVKMFINSSFGYRNLKTFDDKFFPAKHRMLQDEIFRSLMIDWITYDKKGLSANNGDLKFVSYASEDWNIFVSKIVTNTNRVESYWIDRNEIIVGTHNIRERIESAISFCDQFIIVLSLSYLSKGWTKYELERIFEEYIKRGVQIEIVLYHINVGLLYELLQKSGLSENVILGIKSIDVLGKMFIVNSKYQDVSLT